MSRKRRLKSNKRNQQYELAQALIENGKASVDGPRRKKWSKHDLCTINPLTDAQENMFHAFMNNCHVCAYGTAGTGKTFIALFLAFNEYFQQSTSYDKIIIVRSNVATRQVGHLPGSLEEKMSVYERPYRDILTDLFGRPNTYDDMKAAGVIEFMPTSFVRGSTWDNAIVIVDEVQNQTAHEISSIMTRVGENSKVFVLGDTKQTDLSNKQNDVSGFAGAIEVFKRMPEFAMIQFTRDDIVRSKFVKSWIVACEELNYG